MPVLLLPAASPDALAADTRAQRLLRASIAADAGNAFSTVPYKTAPPPTSSTDNTTNTGA